MATLERAIDRGTARGRRLLAELGREVRDARMDRGLSLAEVARVAGISAPTLSRIERGLVPTVSVLTLARLFAVVGLDFSARAFPGGQPLRDAGHLALLSAFRSCLHRSLHFATEVPLPLPGDQRAWDGLLVGPDWRYGVEAETAPRDAQSVGRRLALKARDGQVDGVLVVLPATRRSRAFLDAAGDGLRASFPIDGRRAIELLRAGVDPGGSAIIVLPVGRPPTDGAPAGRCTP